MPNHTQDHHKTLENRRKSDRLLGRGRLDGLSARVVLGHRVVRREIDIIDSRPCGPFLLALLLIDHYTSNMAARSQIEWTEMTWNPVTGCTKISPGCKHCYAEAMSKRLKAMGTVGYENGFAISLMPERLDQPLRRKTPTVWFVNSMSDLFHPKVPFGYIEQVMERIEATPQHIYQILTKRPARMAKFFSTRNLPSHVWLGVTVEDRKYGLPRIDELRSIDASVRFLSIEPLIEDLEDIDLSGMDWAIIGGESGPKARPMRVEWVRRIQIQCERDAVAFFFKQWGAHGADGIRRAKSANGRLLDGAIYGAMPPRRSFKGLLASA